MGQTSRNVGVTGMEASGCTLYMSSPCSMSQITEAFTFLHFYVGNGLELCQSILRTFIPCTQLFFPLTRRTRPRVVACWLPHTPSPPSNDYQHRRK